MLILVPKYLHFSQIQVRLRQPSEKDPRILHLPEMIFVHPLPQQHRHHRHHRMRYQRTDFQKKLACYGESTPKDIHHDIGRRLSIRR